MSASSSSAKTINFRSKTFWLFVVFVVYSLFGWFAVPKIVDAQLKDNLKKLAKWDTQINNIVFNPYSLSLTLSGADIKEETSQDVVAFERLFINFNLLKTLTGTISFDEITLDNPVVNVDIDKSGQTNFQRAFVSDTPEEVPENTEESGEAIAISFDLIAINSGKVHFSDYSTTEKFELNLEPISLALEGFSTHHNEGGEYDLSISLNDQAIKWNGQIGIAPFKSKGHLELTNISSETFWHYAKSASPYLLNQARISLAGDYDTAIEGEQTRLLIENTELRISDVIVSENSESDPLLSFNSLKVAPISFDLNTLSLDLGQIELDQANIFVERAEDASLNILRPLSAAKPDAKTESSSSAEASATAPENKSDFHWKIAGINIKETNVLWKDLALANPAQLSLNDIDIKLGSMSEDLSKAFPYELSFSYNDSITASEENAPAKKQRISGSLSPQPFTVKGSADISNIELASVQNYISESANISINQGRLSLNSEYDLALKDRLSGKILSKLNVDDLGISDLVVNKPLSGFKQFSIDPISVLLPENVNELIHIEIGTVTLDQPYGEVLIAEDGQLNLSHISKNVPEPAANNEETVSAVDAVDTEEQEPEQTLSMLLKLFELKQGKFTYTDASLSPAFTTQISDLSGTIEGISSDTEAKSKVAFSGNVDTQGKLKVNGTLNPLSKTPNTDLNVLINNVDLSMASPYSAKYAGYQIEKGKLDMHLNYQINDTKLKAKNQIILNQFNFGKSVKSPDATSMPLPLAIGILKDRNGKIDIDLPISGDLNDPSFKVTSVILNTFVNLITKVVTSPFSILGGLIEGGDDISEVTFAANSPEINAEQRERILTLAKALKERPNLTLEIRGVADSNLDQANGSPVQEHQLIKLAKDRAMHMSNIVIEEGNIDAARVFILEPEIIALTSPETNTEQTEKAPLQTAPSVSSKFTLGVR